MKIVYLSDSILPSRTANSIHVMKMCQAFAQNGHEVILLAPDVPQIESNTDNIYNFYGVENCFEVKKIPWLNWKKKGIYFYGFLSAKQAQDLKADLTYGRCLQACFFASFLGLPVIYEAHTLPIKVSKVTAWMFQRLKNSSNLKKIIVISEALKTDFQKQYLIRDNLLKIAHDGADQVINLDTSLRLTDKFNVGYIGHLYPGKGMEIVAELVKACPWAFFHIIGGTDTDINYWQNKLINYQNINFYGFIPPSETLRYRLASDVLIAPYQRQVSTSGGGNIAQWMSPLKIFEYMAVAKPIIASNLPVLQEVLTHEVTALLYSPEDIPGWIDGLTRLRDDAQLRVALGANAKSLFDAQYTWLSRANNVIFP